MRDEYNYELYKMEEGNKSLKIENQNLINELNNEKSKKEFYNVENINDKLEDKLDNMMKENGKRLSSKISKLFVNTGPVRKLLEIFKY